MPLEKVAPGDAVVAFSRRAVHENREVLVAAGHRVATIYGALSPEVRRAEAARFRTGEADVLVTTDAIGMGLNLGPLQRVVFSAVRKYDGVGERALTNSEIRQIAGRAGRYGHQEVGYVAACEETVERLANDPRYFARPERALFADIRRYFPITAQAQVSWAVSQGIGAAVCYVEEQIECGAFDGGAARCHATTRKGKPCQRTPLPEREYCPSHQHLETGRTPASARAAA